MTDNFDRLPHWREADCAVAAGSLGAAVPLLAFLVVLVLVCVGVWLCA